MDLKFGDQFPRPHGGCAHAYDINFENEMLLKLNKVRQVTVIACQRVKDLLLQTDINFVRC
jgi:hypothetical protein